jgi:hypothetical protein
MARGGCNGCCGLFLITLKPTIMLYVIFAAFAICYLIERLNLGWKLPEVPTWTIRVLAINFVQLGIVLLAGISWEKWLSSCGFDNEKEQRL